MPMTLADRRIKLTLLTAKPADLAAITITALNAGVQADARILKSDYKLGAVASDVVNEAALSADGKGVVFGSSNFEGSITPIRFLDEDGATDTTGDVVYQAVKEKGTTLWAVEREGPLATTAWAAGDEYEVYEVITDTPQPPTDRTAGFIKRIVPLGVQNHVSGVAAAGA